jgi:hypothetical protein
MYLKAEFCKYLAGLDSLKSGFPFKHYQNFCLNTVLTAKK